VRVLVFTLVITLLTGIIFGTFPALQLSRVDLNMTQRDEGRGTSGGHSRARMSGLLVVSQVALSLLLLMDAGLLLHSFRRLLSVDTGFERPQRARHEHLAAYGEVCNLAQQIAFLDEILRRVSALPGVHNGRNIGYPALRWKRITPLLPEGQPDVSLSQRPFLDIGRYEPARQDGDVATEHNFTGACADLCR
jgi:hypothetical protein